MSAVAGLRELRIDGLWGSALLSPIARMPAGLRELRLPNASLVELQCGAYLNDLRVLSLRDCARLVGLPVGFRQCAPRLRELDLRGCFAFSWKQNASIVQQLLGDGVRVLKL
jgi:hypothetical protein